MISHYPDEQMLWLISSTAGTWQTWFFAYWMPGEHRYEGFRSYMEEQLEEIEQYNNHNKKYK